MEAWGADTEKQLARLLSELPNDILLCHLPRFLPYRVQWALGQTCRWRARRWKWSVTALPACLCECLTDERLALFPRLTTVDLHFALRQAPSNGEYGPGAKVYRQYGPSVTDAGLGKLSHITALNLRDNYHITDAGITHLTGLKALEVSFLPLISDVALSRLTSLTTLTLGGASCVSDAGISGLTNLRTLGLCRNDQITEAAVCSLTNLTCLDLRQNHVITVKGVSSLPALKTLHIDANGNADIIAFAMRRIGMQYESFSILTVNPG